MLPQEIIRKKRNGEELSATELKDFFYGFLSGTVADYQMGAMLMATTLKGMTPEETVELTRVMRDSGSVLKWTYPSAQIVDKHSTGGVGDKVSLSILPLCVLEGLRVPMTAGRGLGHTGGTLDKLEAVGWNVYPTEAEARALIERFGGVFMGQTDQIAPLDRRLYAMRDVTATVESIPLIVGSILSKKLAEGIGGLVMDVKFGSGAFMRELPDARRLACELKRVGAGLGLEMRCALTDMNSPLGDTAGNALEIHEALEILQGRGPKDSRELTLGLAVAMIGLAYPERASASIQASLEKRLQDGSAYELFLKLGEAQGADLSLLKDPKKLLRAKRQIPVILKGGTQVASCNVRDLGLAVLELGGGRRLSADKIDPWVGLTGMKRVGATVAPGEPVAIVHANDGARGEAAVRLVENAYRLGDGIKVEPLLAEWL